MNTKHKHALQLAIQNVTNGRSMRHPISFSLLAKWRADQRIPMIHVGEVARLAGLLPSEVDPFWQGRDGLFITWEKNNG